MKFLNWFSSGLLFSCQGCGKCCKGPGGYVWVDEDEISAFAEVYNISEKEFTKKYVRNVKGRLSLIDNANGDCIFLDDNGKCKHYELRPKQCSTFPWWPEIIISKEVWESNFYKCPGIGVGELHTEEEILENLRKQL